MKFENKGKWIQEAEEKLVFDNREKADFNEEDELSGELLSEVESDEFIDELDRPEEEEDAVVMADESSQKNEGKFKITDNHGMFFYKTAKDSGWTNGQSKLYPIKVFNTRQEAEKCIKDEYLGPEVKIVQESSQKNESNFKVGDKVVNKTFKPGKSELVGTVLGIEKDDEGETVVKVQMDNIKRTDAKPLVLYKEPNELKKYNESSQKNEAIGDSSWDEAIRQIAGGINKILPSLTAAKSAYDEMEDLQSINKSEYLSCFNSLIDYFNKEALLMKHIANIDVDANDYNKWFKPLADFVKKRKIESSQKNEAKQQGRDIDLDNVGGGFTVSLTWQNKSYGFECSGYSNNTSGKKLVFTNDKIAYTEQGFDEMGKLQPKLTKDLKDVADKFDKDIEAVFAKYGFKKAR